MAHEEDSLINKPAPIWIIGAVAAVVVIAAGVAYFLHSGNAGLPHGANLSTSPATEVTEPAVQHRVPQEEVGAQKKTALPSLAESDAPLREALASASGNVSAAQYLVPDSLIRHLVVTVDNLARQKVALDKRPVLPATGSFSVDGDELHATIDAQNYARYKPMVDVIRELDMPRLAGVYFHFYPLFQHAFQDLGYPTGYFNDRLVQVIDLLLATPPARAPVELVRPNVMYTFADPTLEALPAGQKIMIRMGPDNEKVIKAKLQELRTLLTAPAVRPR